jgi:hypothetical protein
MILNRFSLIPVWVVLMLGIYSCAEKSKKTTSEEITLDRPGYTMKYPANWKVDSSDEDFDYDSYFTLDTHSDNGFISIFIFNDSISTDVHVEEQIKAHLKQTIKNGAVTRYTSWGNYTGTGARIRGKLMGVFKGEVNVFAYSTDSSGFLALYQLFDSDRKLDESGFELIKSSFRLK